MYNKISSLLCFFLLTCLSLTAQEDDGTCICDTALVRESLIMFSDTLNSNLWDRKVSLQNWSGVYLSSNGCLDSLILINRNLRGALPASLFEINTCLQTLNLSHTEDNVFATDKISGAIPASIGRLTKLRSLMLSWNNIEQIPPEIGRLKSLELLDLRQNLLSAVPEEIGQLEQLRVLRIGNFEDFFSLPVIGFNPSISSIPASIGNLSNLEVLEIYDQGLNTLPETIGQLFNLKVLNLGSNQLEVIPESIENLSHLEICLLGHNRLLSLPVGLIRLKQLKILDISANIDFATSERLSMLPNGIGNLTSLETLDLSHNDFSFLPDELFHLRKLKKLDVSFNPDLQQLPSATGQLVELKYLAATDLSLETLPDELGDLPKLETLLLSFNESLSSLPETIGRLNALKSLDLGNCDLRSVPASIGGLENLEYLRLDHNQLETVAAGFWTFPELKELSLNGNQLSGTLPVDVNNLTVLKILDVKENDFSSLPRIELDSLQKLDVSRNRLTFDDILKNKQYFAGPNLYQPQQTIDMPDSLFFSACEVPQFKLDIDPGINNNEYTWFRNDISLGTLSSNIFSLPELIEDSTRYNGTFRLEVTNPEVLGLNLRSEPFEVSICTDFVTLDTTLCPGEQIVVNARIYDAGRPSGCEVIRTGEAQCPQTIRVNLRFFDPGTLIRSPICEGESIEVNGTLYGCFRPTGEERFTSAVTGCDSLVRIELACETCTASVQDIPEVFTPNRDGVNDTFVISPLRKNPVKYGQNELLIYNRFNELVYRTKNYFNNWEGHDIEGRELPAGTYKYLFTYPSGQWWGMISIVK